MSSCSLSVAGAQAQQDDTALTRLDRLREALGDQLERRIHTCRAQLAAASPGARSPSGRSTADSASPGGPRVAQGLGDPVRQRAERRLADDRPGAGTREGEVADHAPSVSGAGAGPTSSYDATPRRAPYATTRP